MDIKTKERGLIESKFKRNNIPTEDDFKDLIYGMINQKSDGFAKLQDKPLSIRIEPNDDTRPALDFYEDFEAETELSWRINLAPINVAPGASGRIAGFNIGKSSDSSELFIKFDNGFVGIGTTNTTHRLTVNGDISLSGLLIQPPWQPILAEDFEPGWKSEEGSNSASYFRDTQGFVHLRGTVLHTEGISENIFKLREFSPEFQETHPALVEGEFGNNVTFTMVRCIVGREKPGTTGSDTYLWVANENDQLGRVQLLHLNGISFKAR